MKEYVEALDELIIACKEEFKRGQSEYGDSWKDASVTIHLNTVVNDALKFEHINPSNTKALKHRITDITNYLVFIWAKLP